MTASRVRRFAIWLALLTVVTRLPALLHPRPINDEDFYSLVAFEILEGGKPYVDAVERKPPLLFWVYAAVFWLSGPYNWVALHAVAVGWVLLTMAGIFAVARELFDAETGLTAALFYAIFQPYGVGSNLAFNGEVLMNLPIVWAVFLVLRQPSTAARRRSAMLGAGILLAAAFLLKQPAAVAAIPLGLYLLVRRDREVRRLAITPAAMLTAGFAGTLGVVVAVLYAQGILADAYYWTIADHALPHGPSDPMFWTIASRQSLWFVLGCAPVVLGAVASVGAAIGRERPGVWSARRDEGLALVGLLAVSVVGVSASGRFYSHYFIQVILPLSLLAAPVYTAWWRRSPSWRLRSQAWLGLTVFGFLVAHIATLADERRESEAGRYVREHSTPQDRMFVWGQSAKIYLDARRRPATRYIGTYPLTGHVFGSPLSWDPSFDTRHRIVPGAWDNFVEDVRRHPPLFIVDTDGVRSVPRYPMTSYPILRAWLDDYDFVHRARGGLIYRRRERVESDQSGVGPR